MKYCCIHGFFLVLAGGLFSEESVCVWGGGERNAIPRSLSISIFALSPWWSRFGGNSRCDGMALELPLGKASIKHRHPLMAVRAQHPP